MSERDAIDAALDAAREHGTDPRVQRAGRWTAVALFAVLLFAPGIPLEPLQRRAAAVTALVAVLWLSQGIPLGAASLLPVALLPLLGVVPAREAAMVYMDDIVLLFFGAFIVAAGLERWGVHRRMALAVVDWVGTRPRSLVLGFTAATAFVSLWINNTAATLMMYPIGLAVITTVAGGERARSSPFGIALLLGIAYGASIGGVATPVGTAPNQILLGLIHSTFPDAPPISFGQWFLGWIPFTVLYVLGVWLVLTRFSLRVDNESLAARETILAERARLGRMTRGEVMMSCVFAMTALLWVTREDLRLGAHVLPGWGGAVAHWQALGMSGTEPLKFARHVSDATVALAVGCLCFFLPVERKSNTFLLDWATVQRLPWDVLLLFGGGFCIAKGFQSSGLDAALGRALAPVIEGLPMWALVAVIAAFMTFLSELTSNTVITNLMLPILAQTAVQGGVNPLALMVPATIAASSGFMLPVATPPNAIAFSSRLIPMRTMARVGWWVDVLGVVLLALVFELYTRHVLDIELALPAWVGPH
ncbi:MAG: SLC13/DASS family transporter [Planctomycetes bacterium]|nr:SLC13/DASS family transporter [Planctomycetota bacterium]